MQFDPLKRREFIMLLGGAAATWPLAARAQQAKLPIIGFLHSGSAREYGFVTEAFRKGVNEAGFDEGRDILIDYRWAHDQPGRLRELADELVRRPVSVLVTGGGTISALAAKAATKTIPIVFATGIDPVESKLVESLNRPGGNATGVSFLAGQLGPKRLELLHEMSPKTTKVAVLVNPINPGVASKIEELQIAGRAVGIELILINARTETELTSGFAGLIEQSAGAVLIDSDPFFTSHREEIALLAVRHGLPTIYFLREYPLAGGLMSYGASVADAHRQAGIYAGRILRGDTPAELPVVQSTKVELIINLRTARTLDLKVPDKLLASPMR